MNRIERLTGIVIALQGGPRSAASLAERFEVSRRTIMRDVDALAELGIPIVAESGRGGGYRLMEGFSLPPMHLTADEATVLLFALAQLGPMERSPLGAAHTTIHEKLRAILTPTVASDTARNLDDLTILPNHDDPDPDIIALIRAALRDDTWLAITYQRANESTERTIHPTRLYTSEGRWYVDAWCALRDGDRQFRVSRITSARRTAVPANAPTAQRDRRPYHHPDHPEVRATLTARGIALAKDRPDLASHVDGNRLAFHCPPSELPYYGRELLLLGRDVLIEGPPDLIAWVQHELRDLISHHASCENGDTLMSPNRVHPERRR